MLPLLKKKCESANASSTSRSRCSRRNGRRQSKNGEEEDRAQREPDVGRVDACGRTRPGSRAPSARHLVAGPDLERGAGRGRRRAPGPISWSSRRSSSPASGRALGVRGGLQPPVLAQLALQLRHALRRSRSPGARSGGSRVGGSVCEVGSVRVGWDARRRWRRPRPPARQRKRDGGEERRASSRTAAGRSLAASVAKLQILFPTKLSGVAATIEIA